MDFSIIRIKVFLVSLLFIVLMGGVNAFDLNIICYDYNTNNTISDVLLDLNTTSNVTNDNGEAVFYGNGSYILNATRTGYHFYTSEITLTGNQTLEMRLFPSTSDGFFRDKMVDLTFGYSNITICLYYANNNRLHGCYQTGDNITTNENINYTVRVLMRKTDAIVNVTTFGSMLRSWGFPIIILIIIFAFIIKVVLKK